MSATPQNEQELYDYLSIRIFKASLSETENFLNRKSILIACQSFAVDLYVRHFSRD